MMEAVSVGLRSASSPTRCTDWAWTCPWTWATSIICAVGRRSFRQGRERSGKGCGRIGGEHALEQRAHHHEHDDDAEDQHHAQFDEVHDVVFGELEHAEKAFGGFSRDYRWRFREFQVDDLDLIAALLVEADGRAHQRADHFEVFLRACRVDDFALLVLAVAAVDQHGDRDAVDAAGFGHFGLGDAGNLVIVDFLALLALVFRGGGAAALSLAAGQLIVDGDLTVVGVRGRG